MSTRRLVFVGHISIDKIENIILFFYAYKMGELGGAAFYSAMAARTLSSNVILISATGKDNNFLNYLDLIPYSDVKIYNIPSTKFHIRYDDNWEAHYLKVEPGAGSKITSRRISKRWLRDKSIFHLSPMTPVRVKKILDKIKKTCPESQVSVNTWLDYIRDSRKNRRILNEIAMEADFFIVNDTEAKALTQTKSISSAVRNLKAKRLIVTLGSLGAIINGEEVGLQMYPALTLPPDRVIDTTGAGDVWCGAFLATYNITGDFGKSVNIASTISRIKCSNWGFQSLIDQRFKEPNDVIEFFMGLKDGVIQKTMQDYLRD